MPNWIPGKLDIKTMVFMEVQGVSRGDYAFDSELKVSQNASTNHTLQINLRVFLDKHQPANQRWDTYQDANGRQFVVGPWNQSEWQRFVQGFLKQSNLWNNNFWLIPPVDFTRLDFNAGAKTIRPNVYCSLNVQIVGGPGSAHITVTVVNLDAKLAANQQGIDESQVDRDTFRSDSQTYDTFDTTPGTVSVLHDETGALVPPMAHSTIAHEIGHALGQPHIGVMRHAPLCQMAMLLEQMVNSGAIPAASVPAMLRGGRSGVSNDRICYGDFANVSISANIMGGGNRFEAINAQPWLDVIPIHTNTKAAWTVRTGRVAPKVM